MKHRLLVILLAITAIFAGFAQDAADAEEYGLNPDLLAQLDAILAEISGNAEAVDEGTVYEEPDFSLWEIPEVEDLKDIPEIADIPEIPEPAEAPDLGGKWLFELYDYGQKINMNAVPYMSREYDIIQNGSELSIEGQPGRLVNKDGKWTYEGIVPVEGYGAELEISDDGLEMTGTIEGFPCRLRKIAYDPMPAVMCGYWVHRTGGTYGDPVNFHMSQGGSGNDILAEVDGTEELVDGNVIGLGSGYAAKMYAKGAIVYATLYDKIGNGYWSYTGYSVAKDGATEKVCGVKVW